MSVKRRFSSLSQHGDTIVEVMIVLAVLGLAIGISYATANGSLLETREAQENNTATQLLQAQVERVYALSPNDVSFQPVNKYVFQTTTMPFCLSAANTVVPITNAACNPSPYKISILYCKGSGDPLCAGHGSDDTFILKAVWEDVRAQGDDTVTLTYRVHP